MEMKTQLFLGGAHLNVLEKKQERKWKFWKIIGIVEQAS